MKKYDFEKFNRETFTPWFFISILLFLTSGVVIAFLPPDSIMIKHEKTQ